MKKIKVALLIFISFLFILFLYLTMSGKPQEREVVDISKDHTFENPENYLLGERGEKTIIQNQNLNFSFAISKNWAIEGFEEDLASGITFLSEDYNEDENSFMERGCKIIVMVYDEKNEYSYLKESIRNLEKGLSVIEIDNHFGEVKGEGSLFRSIKVPLNNHIYAFEGYFSETEKEYCEKNYNDMISSISLEDEK